MQEAAALMMRGRDLNWGAFPLTGVFRTTDRPIVMVGAFKENPLRDICEALEIEDLSKEERFSDFDRQAENRAELQAIFRNRFAEKGSAHWLKRLEAVDILCAPVKTLGEALEDEQTLVNRMILEGGRTENGPIRLINSPIDMSGAEVTVRIPPPALGAHNDEILKQDPAKRKFVA
jgi:formyl-CoA transferase